MPKAKTIAMPLAYGIGLAMQFPISSDNDHSKDNCNGISNENYYNSRLFLTWDGHAAFGETEYGKKNECPAYFFSFLLTSFYFRLLIDFWKKIFLMFQLVVFLPLTYCRI